MEQQIRLIRFGFPKYTGTLDQIRKEDVKGEKNMKKGKEIVSAKMNIWLPTVVGEMISGKIKEVFTGQYGVQLKILDEDGQEIVTPSHKALQCKLDNFKVGDCIIIEYAGLGVAKARGENEPRIYKVFVARE